METTEELYEGAPCGYVSLDPAGTIVRSNRRFAEMMGTDTEQVVGTALAAWMAPGSRIYLDTHVFPLLYLQDAIQEVALEARTQGGTKIPLLADARLVRDATGDPRTVRMTLVDARQRRRYEQELLLARREAEAARRQADAVLEATPEPLLTVDADGRVVHTNAEARAFFETSDGRLRGRPLDALLGLDRADLPPMDGAARPASAFLETDVSAHGKKIPIEIRWKTLDTSAEERCVVSIRDLRPVRALESERLEARTRQLELQRVRADDAFKTRFIDTAAHALRTPLMTLRLQLELLKKDAEPVTGERYWRAVEILDRQTERLHHIAEQLLAVTRIDTDATAAHAIDFRLAPLVDRVVEKMATPAAEKGIEIALEPQDLVLHGNPEVVERVLLDLLDNAIKFTPNGGHVTVAVERPGADARIAVTDTGIGIPPDQIDRVFETFGQVHTTHVTDLGVGLSLYLARQLLHRSGGTIGAESPGPGKGARFWFTVPTPDTPPPAEEASHSLRPSTPSR